MPFQLNLAPRFHLLWQKVFITYSGWTNGYQSRVYNTMRIWGKFYPFVGIGEENAKAKMESAKLLEVYPNQAGSFLAVRLPSTADRQTLKIFDISGKLIRAITTLVKEQIQASTFCNLEQRAKGLSLQNK